LIVPERPRRSRACCARAIRQPRDRAAPAVGVDGDDGRGSGHGLAIARSIVVEKHGGTLIFETEKRRGATAVIRLPPDTPAPVARDVAGGFADIGQARA